jgi:hypothetical protein
MNRDPVNLLQLVPGSQPGIVPCATGLDKQRDYGIFPVHPGDAVVRKMKEALLSKVDYSAADCRYCQDEQ